MGLLRTSFKSVIPYMNLVFSLRRVKNNISNQSKENFRDRKINLKKK